MSRVAQTTSLEVAIWAYTDVVSAATVAFETLMPLCAGQVQAASKDAAKQQKAFNGDGCDISVQAFYGAEGMNSSG